LKNFVDSHNKLIELSDAVQEIFGLYVLLFVAQSSLVISLMCFQLASTDQLNYLAPFILTTLNQVWLMCHFGQKLHDSSSSVADGIFECDWYQLDDRKMKRIIPFIIQRCQREKVIKARGFAVIKLSTFMGVKN
jgi:gustatory receptor